MWSRVFFLLVTLFFLTMNVLLWRTEIAGHNELGSAVSAQVVWNKVLTAPDSSPLEIRHHGAKIGIARWVPSVGEDLSTGRRMSEEPFPEGMVKALSSYNLELDGNFALDEFNRLRFNFNLTLSTNYTWQELSLRLSVRPYVWEINSVAAEQTVRLRTEDERGRGERVYKFSELQNPEKLLRQLGGPVLPGILMALGVPLRPEQASSISLGLNWQGRNDSLQMRHARLRGYRLQARLLDRYQVALFVNTLGEIIRVELPDEIVLVSEHLAGL
jgi:hypothetical protein